MTTRSTRSAYLIGLFRMIFLGVTLSLLSAAVLAANDIVKRRIASEATEAGTDDEDRRRRLVSLTRKIDRYESRKADLIRRRIVRVQGVESANRSVETFLELGTGLGSGGSTAAVTSALAFAFGEFLHERFPEGLEVQEDAQALLRTARDVQTVTQGVASILQKTGVMDAEDSGVAANVDNVVSSAATLVGNVHTGNLLSVVVGVSDLLTGVSNLFGEPGDGTVLRDVLEGQVEIRRELLEARKEIAEGVDSILLRVGEFEERTILAFEEIGVSIQGVQWELGALRDMLRDYSALGVSLTACENFTNRRSLYDFVSEHNGGYVPEVVILHTGKFRTWNSLTQHYQSNDEVFQECFPAMRLLFSVGRIHPAFLMSTYPDDDGSGFVSSYIRPGFEPLARILNRHYPLLADDGATGGGMRTFCALLNSPLAYGGIDHRGYTLFASEPCSTGDPSDPFDRLVGASGLSNPGSVSWLLHPDALIHFTYLLLEILPYYQIVDEEGELLASDVVAYQEPRRDRVVEVEALETAYRLVNLAIAQQVLLTGDIFLPLVHRYLFSPLTSPTADRNRKEMIDVLRHNRLIAKNYLVMQLHRELQLRTRQDYGDADDVFVENLELYQDIFQSRSSDGDSDGHYEQLFSDNWEFSPSVNEVVFRIGGGSEAEAVRFPLPTPAEVGSASYSVSREYENLVKLRSRIIDYVVRNDLELFSADDEEEFVRNGYFVWN